VVVVFKVISYCWNLRLCEIPLASGQRSVVHVPLVRLF
jgi:hypothetical protein